MKSDDRTRRIEVAEEHDENNHVEHEVETDPADVRDSQPTGWAAQLRQLMQRSRQGEARTNIKRQQLKEDRTKSFLLLAGLTVVLSLAFFAMFSTPNSRKDMARSTHPNLGRGSGGENSDTGRSVTPLLSADTRRPDDNAGSLSPEDIHNTAKQRTLAQASPSFGTAPEPPVSTPRRIRLSDLSKRLQTVCCLIATKLKAVGITQLAAPGIQGQPYLSGLKRTSRSANLNFQRQNQWLSLPRSRRSQSRALSRALDTSFSEISVESARLVVHVPSASP